MDDRKVTRIAVSPEANKVIGKWAQSTDMTKQGIASRIYEWFGGQREEVQRAILGMYGGRAPDLARLILAEMALDSKQSSPALEALIEEVLQGIGKRRGRGRSFPHRRASGGAG